MKYFAIALLAFIAITSVQGSSQYYFHEISDCVDQYNSTCLQNSYCRDNMNEIQYCFYRLCYSRYDDYSLLYYCYNNKCAPIANNSTNSQLKYYSYEFSQCLSSEVISFAFILLISILSAIIAQY
ncbi:hypothetical protein ABPG74_019839 [Tetrahymena malaccensis]